MADIIEVDEFLDPVFRFKVGGREYAVAEVAWPEYLGLARLQQEITAAVKAGDPDKVDGDEWWALAPRVLGDVLDELIADRVGGARITLLARSAWYFQLGNRQYAEALLRAEGKEPTPTPDESGSTSTTPTGSTSSESETETKPPASTTATTSPTKSARRSRSSKAETPAEAVV